MIKNKSKIELFDIKLDNLPKNQVLENIFTLSEKKTPSYITTTNVEFLMRSLKDPEFRKILNSAALNLIDGHGVIWGYLLLNSWAPKFILFRDIYVVLQMVIYILFYPVIVRLFKKKYFITPGADIVWDIAEKSVQERKSIYLLGNKNGLDPNAVEKASLELQTKIYDLKIAGTHSFSGTDEESKNVVYTIKHSGADFVFCSLGSPSQEYWMHKYLSKSGAKVAIGVGGSLDFIAKVQNRAPKIIRLIGFEWLYRLIRQPKRIKRQKAILDFIIYIIKLKLT